MTEIYQSARVPSRGKRERSPDWGDEETTALVSLRADDTVQERFSSMGRNKPIWEDISMEMRKLSHNRTAEMCKNKMDILKTVYKTIKDTTNETGKERRSDLHFELIDSILDECSYSPVFAVSRFDVKYTRC